MPVSLSPLTTLPAGSVGFSLSPPQPTSIAATNGMTATALHCAVRISSPQGFDDRRQPSRVETDSFCGLLDISTFDTDLADVYARQRVDQSEEELGGMGMSRAA